MGEDGAPGGSIRIRFRVVEIGGAPALRVERSDGAAYVVTERGRPSPDGSDAARRALFPHSYNLFLARGTPTDRDATERPGRIDLADGSRLLPSPAGWQVVIFGGKDGEDGRALLCGTDYEAAALLPPDPPPPGR